MAATLVIPEARVGRATHASHQNTTNSQITETPTSVQHPCQLLSYLRCLADGRGRTTPILSGWQGRGSLSSRARARVRSSCCDSCCFHGAGRRGSNWDLEVGDAAGDPFRRSQALRSCHGSCCASTRHCGYSESPSRCSNRRSPAAHTPPRTASHKPRRRPP